MHSYFVLMDLLDDASDRGPLIGTIHINKQVGEPISSRHCEDTSMLCQRSRFSPLGKGFLSAIY
jgi:hypothetical protein